MRHVIISFILLFGFAKPALSVEAFEAWRERSSMLLIAGRCDALGKLEEVALLSGQLQARGALLRSAEDPQKLDELHADLEQRAELISCDDPAVQSEITRMRDAAQVWSHLYTMHFPARWQSWTARRDDAREKARWRVRMPINRTAGLTIDFGLTAKGEQVFLGLIILGENVPSSVILKMRDGKRLSAFMNVALLHKMGRSADNPAELMPPQSVLQSFFATQKMPAPLSLTGETKRKAKAMQFRFANTALAAFTALDPRDVVTFELVYPARANMRPKRQYIYAEAGDFTAARLFAETFPEEAAPPTH